MQLVLVHPPNFEKAPDLVDGIAENFPKLITRCRLVGHPSLACYFRAEDIEHTLEYMARPDWRTDVVLIMISGPIYAYEELPLNSCAGTIQGFLFGEERSLPKVPKIGGYYNMRQIRALNLDNDIRFLSKLAAEEILHIFAVPKEHDRSCFFHPERHPSRASCANEFCRKCRTLPKSAINNPHSKAWRKLSQALNVAPARRKNLPFREIQRAADLHLMNGLTEPLDFGTIYRYVDDLYGKPNKPQKRSERVLGERS